jgi:hypothetical protein
MSVSGKWYNSWRLSQQKAVRESVAQFLLSSFQEVFYHSACKGSKKM